MSNKPLGEQLREKTETRRNQQAANAARKSRADDERKERERVAKFASGQKNAREKLMKAVNARADAGHFDADILAGVDPQFLAGYEAAAKELLQGVSYRFYDRKTYPRQYAGAGFYDSLTCVVERRLQVWWGDRVPDHIPDEARG